MGVDDGETLHGFRSGCAITLALSGIELSEIMDHVDWNPCHTALHYLQLAKVLNPIGASAKLASSEVMSVDSTWQDINELKRFVCAFPSLLFTEKTSIGLITEPESLFIYQQDIYLIILFCKLWEIWGDVFVRIGVIYYGNEVL